MRRYIVATILILALAGTAHAATPSDTPATHQPGDTFKDCDVCPEMVVIPAGQFMMGSPPYEEERHSA